MDSTLTEPGELLLTLAEAGKRLSVSAKTISRLIAAGELESVHVLGCHRVSAGALQAYVAGLSNRTATLRNRLANAAVSGRLGRATESQRVQEPPKPISIPRRKYGSKWDTTGQQ